MSNKEQLVNGCLCSSTLGPQPSTLGPSTLGHSTLGPSALDPHLVGPRPPKHCKKKIYE